MAEKIKTRTELLDEIRSEIREILIADWRGGANDYAYVRVQPTGEVYSGREASYCLPMDEYEGNPPHTVTVWSASGFRESAGAESGVFEWEEVEESRKWKGDGGQVFILDEDGDLTEELPGVFESDGSLYRLTDSLVEEPDLDEIMKGVERQLDERDWLPQE